MKGGIFLGWIQMLEKTYDACESIVGKKVNEDPILLPISHSTANAQLEVTIDMDGNFMPALSGIIPKDGEDKITIIPVMASSRSGKQSSPHALGDKLCYVAGDYSLYTNEDKTEYYNDYLNNLRKWTMSEFSNKWLQCVYIYLKKATLIQDLIKAKVLVLSEGGLLSECENKIQSIAQKEAMVRFAVWDSGEKHELWKEPEMYQSFIEYYKTNLCNYNIDYVTGERMSCSEKHPWKIRNSGDQAKLLSANDTSGFTYRGRFANREQAARIGYETSQKAHNALRWLLARQGKYIDGEMTVVWKLPQNLKEKDSNLALDVVDLFGDTQETFLADFDWAAECRDEDDIELDRKFAEKLNQAMAGYRAKLQPDDEVIILSVDAATTGRLAVTYYQEVPGNEFIDRVLHWHQNCTWPRWIKLHETKKWVFINNTAPSPNEIALAAYGTEQEKGYLACSDKLKKTTIRRILPCIIGLSPKIPADIVKAAVNRASNPQAYSSFVWQNCVAPVACAMIKYNEFDGKVNSMELEKDRSYLFGQLLAILEKVEERALYLQESKTDDRLTNAKKMWNVYTRRPAITYERLYSHIVRAYLKRLNPGARAKIENKIMQIINVLRETDGFNNNPLNERYLLGYYEEREKLIKSKGEKSNEGGEE